MNYRSHKLQTLSFLFAWTLPISCRSFLWLPAFGYMDPARVITCMRAAQPLDTLAAASAFSGIRSSGGLSGDWRLRPKIIGRVNFVIRQIVREVAQQRECHIVWPFIDLRHFASRNRLGYLWIRYLRRRSKFRR